MQTIYSSYKKDIKKTYKTRHMSCFKENYARRPRDVDDFIDEIEKSGATLQIVKMMRDRWSHHMRTLFDFYEFSPSIQSFLCQREIDLCTHDLESIPKN